MIEMSYTYLMTWFAIHYKGLMSDGANDDKEDLPTLCRFEGRWENHYIVEARKVVDR